MNHNEFLSDIAQQITDELKPKCDCPGATERTVTSLVIMACVNGEPIVFSPPELADGDANLEAVMALAKGSMG